MRAIRWVALLLLVAASCPPVSVAAAEGSKKTTAAAHTVSIHGFKFQPDELTVKVGDTIEWKNTDIVTHTVSATDGSFRSGSIKPGASWKFVAKKTGTFDYVCTPHPNMRGRLSVQ